MQCERRSHPCPTARDGALRCIGDDTEPCLHNGLGVVIGEQHGRHRRSTGRNANQLNGDSVAPDLAGRRRAECHLHPHGRLPHRRRQRFCPARPGPRPDIGNREPALAAQLSACREEAGGTEDRYGGGAAILNDHCIAFTAAGAAESVRSRPALSADASARRRARTAAVGQPAGKQQNRSSGCHEQERHARPAAAGANDAARARPRQATDRRCDLLALARRWSVPPEAWRRCWRCYRRRGQH